MTIKVIVWRCKQCNAGEMSDEGAELHSNLTNHVCERVREVEVS